MMLDKEIKVVNVLNNFFCFAMLNAIFAGSLDVRIKIK